MTFDDGYRDLVDYALPVLHEHGFTATVFVASDHVGGTNAWDAGAQPGEPLMGVEEIRAWSRRGVDFGSHGCRHVDLTALADGELMAELRGSRSALGEIVGVPPAALAYPYGAYDERVRSRVRGVFGLAFTTEKGLNGAETDLHLLHRTMVSPNDSVADLALRARLGWSPLEGLRAHTRLRTRGRRAARLLAERRRSRPDDA